MKTPAGIVTCEIHGRFNASNKTKEVRVALPPNKRIRQGGCPICKRAASGTARLEFGN